MNSSQTERTAILDAYAELQKSEGRKASQGRKGRTPKLDRIIEKSLRYLGNQGFTSEDRGKLAEEMTIFQGQTGDILPHSFANGYTNCSCQQKTSEEENEATPSVAKQKPKCIRPRPQSRTPR